MRSHIVGVVKPIAQGWGYSKEHHTPNHYDKQRDHSYFLASYPSPFLHFKSIVHPALASRGFASHVFLVYSIAQSGYSHVWRAFLTCSSSFLWSSSSVMKLLLLSSNRSVSQPSCAEADDAIERTGTDLCVWLSCRPEV